MDFSTAYGLSQGMGAISSIGMGFAQSRALQAQGEYEARMLLLNANLSDFLAQDSLRRGDKAAAAYQQQVAQLKGRQSVATAASGVQLGEGSAAEIEEDTSRQAAQNVVTIRSNAWREAWGYRVQAQDYRGQAAFRRIATDFSANMAIAEGFLNAGEKGVRALSYVSKNSDSGTESTRTAGSILTPASRRTSGLSSSGPSSRGRWGTMQDGSHGYGYTSMWG